MNKPQPDNLGDSNSKSILDYTLSCFRDVNKGLDSIKNKITTILVASGFLLKFASDVPNINFWYLLAKSLIAIVLVYSTLLCLHGLSPNKVGDIVEPRELVDEWLNKDITEYNLFLIKQYTEATSQLESIYDDKAKILKQIYLCISLSTIIFGITIFCQSTVFLNKIINQ